MRKRGIAKRGQITIFIIIAIVIVASVTVFFLIRSKIKPTGISPEFQPVYSYFLSCIEERTKIGAEIIGSQAGYIELSDFEPGSEHMPFSSQLGFQGLNVPYWYYVSGNGIVREQVPSKTEMENQLAKFVEEVDCDFSSFYLQRFEIEKSKPKVKVRIEDNSIKVDLNIDLTIKKDNKRARITEHTIEINSKIGKFYDISKKIYNKEKTDSFLENYGIDVLRLYAPVDGVEITCSPKVWIAENVASELLDALEANTQAIKVKGNYYTLTNRENKYFEVDLGESIGSLGEQVRFLTEKEFPYKIEIWPTETGVMIAEPVGLQEGLGVLGFCYVPYHFVYDVLYTVLIQVYDQDSLFQFPVAVIIQKNKPKESVLGEALQSEPELCKHKLTNINVYTYNSELNPIGADIRYQCVNEGCDIGKTVIEEQDAYLSSLFPQCVDGTIIAKAEGYATKRLTFSTVKEGIADIMLDKLYNLNVELYLDSLKAGSGDMAVIKFEGQESGSMAYPEQKTIKLSEGYYNLSIYVYSSASIYIPSSKTEKCIKVPRSGVLGLFGMTKEECFELEIPAQTLQNALIAGGNSEIYVTESELKKGKLKIYASKLKTPTSLDELQNNYLIADTQNVYAEFENV